MTDGPPTASSDAQDGVIDHPEEREAVAAEIGRVLEDFRARAPWPIPG